MFGSLYYSIEIPSKDRTVNFTMLSEIDTESVGVWLIAGLLVVDKVLAALKARGIDLKKVAEQVDELHRWHDMADTDGVKVWYVRQSLEKTINKQTETIEKLCRTLDRMDRRLELAEARDANSQG